MEKALKFADNRSPRCPFIVNPKGNVFKAEERKMFDQPQSDSREKHVKVWHWLLASILLRQEKLVNQTFPTQNKKLLIETSINKR